MGAMIQDLGWTASNIKTHKCSRRRAIFKCDCGNEWEAPYYDTRTKDRKCKHCRRTTHGQSRTKLYKAYFAMLQRCENKDATGFEYYGGRGITVCNEWHDFKVFFEWASANGYKEQMTIERLDVNKSYSPENCTFIPQSEQWINTKHMRSDNVSGFVGIYFRKDRDKYVAKIDVDGETVQIGNYFHAKNAARAREDYIINNNLPHKRNFDA